MTKRQTTGPRFYRVQRPAEDVHGALATARQILTACAQHPIIVTAWGTIALATTEAVKNAVPGAQLKAILVAPPPVPASLIMWVRDPGVKSWFASQEESVFGSDFWLRTCDPYEGTPMSSVLFLSFRSDPRQEVDERDRFEQWLRALAAGGMLPGSVSPHELAGRFFARLPERDMKTRELWPSAPPTFVEGDVLVSAEAWRATSSDPRRFGPTNFQVTVPLAPPAALSLAAPLLSSGGPLEVHGYFDVDVELATELAAIGNASFGFLAGEGDGFLEEGAVDALLSAVGQEPAIVDWDCTWPDEPRGCNGVRLIANGAGADGSSSCHTPGRSEVYIKVHPQVNGGQADSYAAWIARIAHVQLDD